jgi:Protein of unknown function (DUF3168)
MDLMTEARRSVLSSLKADLGVTGLVPATSIYPQSTPDDISWPFIKTGAVQSVPIRASCIEGSSVVMSIHAFSKGSPAVTAETSAAQIGGAIRQCLDKSSAAISGGTMRIRISDEQLLVDGAEIGSFHYFCVANARCIRND